MTESEQLKTFIGNLANESEQITLSQVYKGFSARILEEYGEGSDISTENWKWKRRIESNAKSLGIDLVLDDDESMNFRAIVLGSNNNNNSNNSNSDNNSSNSNNNTNTNNTNSSNSLNVLLAAADKIHLQHHFAKMDQSHMWTLSTGKKVEEQMIKATELYQYEDMAHSLILDLDDEMWTKHFTSSELQEIKSLHAKNDLDLPSTLTAFLEAIAATDSAKAAAKVARTYDIGDDDDCLWAELAVHDGAMLFAKTGEIDVGKLSEAYILHNLWRILYTCCTTSILHASTGEITSTASSNSKNNTRKPSAQIEQERYRLGSKLDGLYVGGSRELGGIEAGKTTKGNSSKEFSDGLKLSKVLKDMLWELSKENPAKNNEMVTVGFLVMGHKVQLLEMDSPGGYVGRLSRSKPFYFPRLAQEFSGDFVDLLQLAWYGKTRMENTLKAITKKSPTLIRSININTTTSNNKTILPSFHRPTHDHPKKRKFSP